MVVKLERGLWPVEINNANQHGRQSIMAVANLSKNARGPSVVEALSLHDNNNSLGRLGLVIFINHSCFTAWF